MHYILLQDKSPLYDSYAYIDAANRYLADDIFVQDKLKVRFTDTMAKSGSPYVVVLCKIKKQDKEKFLNAMQKLRVKLLVCGYTDIDNILPSQK